MEDFITYNEHIQPISLDTPYLKRDFDFELIIWNLSDDNIEQTERVIQYVLKNEEHRKIEESWNICDYRFYEAKPDNVTSEELDYWKKTYFRK